MVEGKAGNSLVGVALSLTERQFGRWVRLIELCIERPGRKRLIEQEGVLLPCEPMAACQFRQVMEIFESWLKSPFSTMRSLLESGLHTAVGLSWMVWKSLNWIPENQ